MYGEDKFHAQSLTYEDHKSANGSIQTLFIENEKELQEYLKAPEKYKIAQYDLPDFINDFEAILKELKKNGASVAPDLNTYKPYKLLENIHIDIKVSKRGPGLFDNAQEPFQGVRKYTPTKRMVVTDPRAPRYSVTAEQMFFDNILKISVLSKNYRNADDAMYFLEDLFNTYRLVFLHRGLLHLRYMERLPDSVEAEGDIRNFNCSMLIYVRTFKLFLQYGKQLEKLTLEITQS